MSNWIFFRQSFRCPGSILLFGSALKCLSRHHRAETPAPAGPDPAPIPNGATGCQDNGTCRFWSTATRVPRASCFIDGVRVSLGLRKRGSQNALVQDFEIVWRSTNSTKARCWPGLLPIPSMRDECKPGLILSGTSGTEKINTGS